MRLNGTFSRWRPFKEGLPQGSVLAPLIFLFVIDSLRSRLPRGLFISKYADDVAQWASFPGLEHARGVVERGVAEVLQWSREKKLQLSTEKCQVLSFSTDPHEAN